MVKIEHEKLGDIANKYFDDIKLLVKARIDFYRLLLGVINGVTTAKELYGFGNIHWKSKNKGINYFLGISKISQKKKEEVQYDKIRRGNIAAWVNPKIGILQATLDHLEVEANLRQLILVDALDSQQLDINLRVTLGIGRSTNDKKIFKWMSHVLDFKLFDSLAYGLASSLEVNTCPYCNRNYINTIIKEKSNIIRPQFDHFFPKSEHPFLALSFYNLIPSCYFCNSSLKNAVKTTHDTHLHPYIAGYGYDCKFNYIVSGVNKGVRHPENYTLFLVKGPFITSERSRQIFGNTLKEGNANLFKIKEIYHSAHRDILGELIEKVDRYSTAHADSIARFFGALHTSKKEFYRFYFGNYMNEKDFNRRPMAKLSRDIISQMIPDFFKE